MAVSRGTTLSERVVPRAGTDAEHAFGPSIEPVVLLFRVPEDHACRLMERVLRPPGVGRQDLKVVNVDASRNPSLVASFGVLSLPTIVVLSHGREVARLTGLRSAEKVARFLSTNASTVAAGTFHDALT